jgi:hypothetical protein
MFINMRKGLIYKTEKMKKIIILILLLLISTYSFGQAVLSGSKGWDGMYNIRADQFFTRCVTAGVTLTDAQKRWYNDSIFVPLSDSGLIGATRAGDSIQALWCFALFPNGSANVAVLNLLSDSNTCLAVNSPTFTDSGVVGNGVTSYLNTNFNPTWDSSICRLNSIGLGFYSLKTRPASNIYCIGGIYDTVGVDIYSKLHIKYVSDRGFGQINGNSEYIYNTDTTARGNFSLTRKAVNLTQFVIYTQYNYGKVSNTTSNSSRVPNLSYFIFNFNSKGKPEPSNYDILCIPFFYITSGLSIDKTNKLANILNNSLKSRGYNVY